MFEELREIGLTENEIKIYTALLEIGTSTPAQVADKIGISRSYIYDALGRLLEKEMVSIVYIKNKKHYQSVGPNLLKEIVKTKLKRIERIVPNLLGLTQKERENIHVEVHKGQYVYKTLLNDITSTLSSKSEVLIFGIDDAVLSAVDPHYLTHLEIYFTKLKRKKIEEKVIIKESSKRLEQAETTKYRFLPNESIGNVAFEVYGNKVAIFLWGKPNYLLLIKNREVANSYRKQFDILWEKANPSPKK